MAKIEKTPATTLKTLAILAELSDGTVRQVYLNEQEIEGVKNLLDVMHQGVVRVSQEVLSVELTEKGES